MRNAYRPAVLAMLVCTSVPTLAQSHGQRFEFNLPAGDLSLALRQVAERTGTNLVAPTDLVEGRQAPALQGSYTADEAVAALLAGSGLRSSHEGAAILIGAAAAPDTSPAGTTPGGEEGTILVTGTRIRGAPIASPVIKLTEDAIRARGQGTLAEAVRSVPQNFGGGQNPGVGNNVPAAKGVNVGSATSVNLRGLGSDATLTLINGHRISYSASRQAIDISTIPLFAVDRIEIVPDGSSALYGSDAVAGVVNVILKRDFEGVQAGIRLGTSTDGGNFEQRYDLVTGSRWDSGGFISSYEFGRTTAILGKDRSYTASVPALTIFPSLKNHSLTVSGHQALGARLSLELDGFFNERVSDSSYALNPEGDITQSGASFHYRERSFALAPTVRWRPRGDWNLFVTGSYAQDHTLYDVKSFFAGDVFDFPGNCYCNHAVAAEVGADGTLFRMPGGPVKIALGAGYRNNKLVRFNGEGATSNISRSQQSYYGYGEVSLPLVSPDQQVKGVSRLSISGAARYERYPGVGDVLTPKFAAIYAPTSDIDLKASWGKSFRAPTLYQQYQAVNLVLAEPDLFGGTGFPAGATALYWEGGNPELRPERATSLSTTLDLHPRFAEGARLELSYFRTKYRDRVVTPIPFVLQALSDPLYAGRATLNPSQALLAAVVASAVSFGNATSSPYDPSRVAVLIDNRSVNAGFQMIQGADVLLTYDRTLAGTLGELHASLNATYLNSKQQLDALQPKLPLAGILYNPPHWSARGDLAWSRGAFTLNGGISYVGGVKDTSVSPTNHIRGMTTIDLTARFKSLAEHGPTRGLEASITIQNLFNVKPATIPTAFPSDTPYDSTNYSPVGRFVAASLIKKW